TKMAVPALPSTPLAWPMATSRTPHRLSLPSELSTGPAGPERQRGLGITNRRLTCFFREIVSRGYGINSLVPLGHQNPLQQPGPLVVQEIFIPAVFHKLRNHHCNLALRMGLSQLQDILHDGNHHKTIRRRQG